MKFSIVTPSYNQREFIETTIRSVLNQSYHDIEYIVVDGMSSDGSIDVIHEYKDEIGRVIVEPDDGQSDAINKGLSIASGDIYAYLNSDDYYFQDTLHNVAEYFAEHPDVDLVYGDCVFVDENGQFIRYFSEISDFDEDRLRNHSDFIMQPAAFWRAEVFRKYGPFEKNLHYGFDWAFWCELAKRGCNISRLPYVLAANRVYPQTKTLSGSGLRLQELKLINQRYKTRTFLHAYYRYSLSELVEKKTWVFSDYIRIPVLALLSYGNILHHFRHYHSKIINGFLPRSGAVMRQASIIMPRLMYMSIRIELAAPKTLNQAVTVSSGDLKIGRYRFDNGSLCLEIELEPEAGDVNIEMEFEKEYPLYHNGLLRYMYGYKPKSVAAIVNSVVMK